MAQIAIQDTSKTPPRAPKMFPKTLPMRPGRHQNHPRRPQELSRYLPSPFENIVFPLVFKCFRVLTLLDRLGTFLERLGAILGRLGASLARLGAILGRLGTILKRLGAIWARPGRVFESQNLPKVAPRPFQKPRFPYVFQCFSEGLNGFIEANWPQNTPR